MLEHDGQPVPDSDVGVLTQPCSGGGCALDYDETPYDTKDYGAGNREILPDGRGKD